MPQGVFRPHGVRNNTAWFTSSAISLPCRTVSYICQQQRTPTFLNICHQSRRAWASPQRHTKHLPYVRTYHNSLSHPSIYYLRRLWELHFLHMHGLATSMSTPRCKRWMCACPVRDRECAEPHKANPTPYSVASNTGISKQSSNLQFPSARNGNK